MRALLVERFDFLETQAEAGTRYALTGAAMLLERDQVGDGLLANGFIADAHFRGTKGRIVGGVLQFVGRGHVVTLSDSTFGRAQ